MLKTELSLVFPKLKGLIDVRAVVNAIARIMHTRTRTHTHSHRYSVNEKEKGDENISAEFTQRFIQPQSNEYCKHAKLTTNFIMSFCLLVG